MSKANGQRIGLRINSDGFCKLVIQNTTPMKLKKVEPIVKDKDGNITFNCAALLNLTLVHF